MAKNKQGKGTRVYKRIEVVGVSQNSIEDAIKAAISKASETLSGLSWFEVKELRGAIAGSDIREYQALVVINFEVR